MKKWGLIITVFYALMVLGLLLPAFVLLAASSTPGLTVFKEVYREWATWVVAGLFIAGQFVLLSLSVDTTPRKLRSRTPIVVSALTTGLLLAVVTSVTGISLLLVVLGESRAGDLGSWARLLSMFFVPWIVWGVMFYRFYREATDPVTRALSWLFRGSVLELLVAVPAHVIVRRRHDCCAPGVTAFGLTSGIAIMLISFGPSVLFLFKKRMERYPVGESAAK